MLILLLLACAPPSPLQVPMVRVPAGSFVRGSDVAHRPDERPAQRVAISAFDLDDALVTVAAFRTFAAATGHRTSAERLGYGMIALEGMKDWEWQRTDGVSWRKPFLDRVTDPADLDPVTLVSFDDGDAYCRFVGKRLPTEAEWEYAMRAGSNARFPWGEQPRRPDGRYGLNHWQGPTDGNEHRLNTLEDGFRYLSPVRAFAPNAWGLHDPVGNVWQLTADWYDPAAHRKGASDDGVAHDPRGPKSGTHRVTRGGSWWCSARTCSGFGLSYRGKNVVDAPYNNVGFRCARSIQQTPGKSP